MALMLPKSFRLLREISRTFGTPAPLKWQQGRVCKIAFCTGQTGFPRAILHTLLELNGSDAKRNGRKIKFLRMYMGHVGRKTV